MPSEGPIEVHNIAATKGGISGVIYIYTFRPLTRSVVKRKWHAADLVEIQKGPAQVNNHLGGFISADIDPYMNI